MTVLGSLATTNAAVTPLTYFWYGVAGQGCNNVEPFLLYQGDYFGFIFCPPSAQVGKLITTTDQDWINSGSTNEANLMTNILTNLLVNTSYGCNSSSYPPLSFRQRYYVMCRKQYCSECKERLSHLPMAKRQH